MMIGGRRCETIGIRSRLGEVSLELLLDAPGDVTDGCTASETNHVFN